MSVNFANNNSLSAITALPTAVSGGALNLISTSTASSSSTISFTSGIDSTYKEYIFKFINIHPSTGSHLTFQGSTDSGSNYNTTITSSFFQAEVSESGSNDALGYQASSDQAQGTSFQRLFSSVSTTSDDSGSGTLHLFEPSSTSFVKHFISTSNNVASAYSQNSFAAGYFNTTSAINAIQFKMSSGNIDSGVIKLYGVS
jgi:hypothetical protein